MAENVMFTGVGKPEAKRTLVTWGKEKLRKSFTHAGAEEAWREKHAKEIQEMTAINASLSDEDRAKAMEKMDKDISNVAKVKVAGNYGAAALVTTVLVGEGMLIGNKDLAKKVADSKYFGFVGKQAQWARTGLEGLIGKMVQFKNGVREKSKGRKDDMQKRLSAALKQDGTAIVGLREYLSTIKIPQLDKLNEQFPVSNVIVNPDKFNAHGLEDPAAVQLSKILVKTADHFGQWQPIVLDKGEPLGFQMHNDLSAVGGMMALAKAGLVDAVRISDSRAAYYPTKEFIELIKNRK